MIRRPATAADVEGIVAMGARFSRETPYGAALAENPDQWRAFAARLIGADDGLLLVAEQGATLIGMIAMLLITHIFSGERIGAELLWWTEPEARGQGIRLLRQAEAWATAHGAQRLQFIAPTAQVGRVYARLGYTAIETAYQRTVSA